MGHGGSNEDSMGRTIWDLKGVCKWHWNIIGDTHGMVFRSRVELLHGGVGAGVEKLLEDLGQQ